METREAAVVEDDQEHGDRPQSLDVGSEAAVGRCGAGLVRRVRLEEWFGIAGHGAHVVVSLLPG